METNHQLKWTDGSICERSPRLQKEDPMKHKELETQLDAIRENSAYLQSLHFDNSALWITGTNQETAQSNKREESFHKMVDREMMGQTGRNPFLDDDYIQHVDTSNKYLKPIATNLDKVRYEGD